MNTRRKQLSFSSRLTLSFTLLLLAYGAFVAVLGQRMAEAQEEETLQGLSRGMAQHIVEHWPEIAAPDRDSADAAARAALLTMLMTVNPAVQVYLLDAQGVVQHYIGDPALVREKQVDLAPVRAFLRGAPLPLRGTDPMGSGELHIFSAAMFAPRPGEAPGYLYVVLDGRARQQMAEQVGARRLWTGVGVGTVVGLLVTLLLGLLTLRRLSLPLQRLAGHMRGYSNGQGSQGSAGLGDGLPASPLVEGAGSEVQAIAQAFDDMTARLAEQAEREQTQQAEHREMMAGLAHDLRTPLTALHGHLEALTGDSGSQPERRSLVLRAALDQSAKVSRLSQQLFEMAALQSTGQVLHRERFRLDDLVTDAVQKFELTAARPAVSLAGVPPGRLELEADLQLIERALSNLIDNALRHASGAVRVSLRRAGELAEILVEDSGPGLPDELHQRLERGASLRQPPIRRERDGIGGLGLAIAQRVAQLHGGSLKPLPAPQGGTRLCLALPLAEGS